MTGGAVIIAGFGVITKVVGLFRERLLAHYFGVSDVVDVYTAAFRLPDFVFNSLVLGALSVAFIPVFVGLWKNHERRSYALSVASSVLNIVTLVLGALAVVGIVVAPYVMPWITPGFSPEKIATTVSLTRVMFVAIIFFGASNLFSSLLNAWKRFIIFSAAPIFYNVGIIVGITVFAKWWGVIGLAWGVVFGALLYLLVQLPAVRNAGFRYQWQWRVRDPAVHSIGRLMLPRTFGLGVQQINQLIMTTLASLLPVGSVAVFAYAANIQSIPVSIFGIAMAISAFANLSDTATDTQMFREHFSWAFRRILFFVLPSSVFMLILRAHIVRLILGTGAFDWDATVRTLDTLGFFALSLFAQALIPLLARSFYALQDTKTPVIISSVAVGVNIAGALIFSPLLGVAGLALSFSIAALMQWFALLTLLRVKIGDLDDDVLLGAGFRMLLGSGIAGIVLYGALYAIAPFVDTRTFVGLATQAGGAAFVAMTVYGTIAWVFRFPEIEVLRRMLEKKS